MKKIIVAPEAENDLAEIYEYLSDRSEADRVIEEIAARLETLAEFPNLGQAANEVRPGLRRFVVGNYLLFYRVASDALEVVRVLHGARNIAGIFGD